MCTFSPIWFDGKQGEPTFGTFDFSCTQFCVWKIIISYLCAKLKTSLCAISTVWFDGKQGEPRFSILNFSYTQFCVWKIITLYLCPKLKTNLSNFYPMWFDSKQGESTFGAFNFSNTLSFPTLFATLSIYTWAQNIQKLWSGFALSLLFDLIWWQTRGVHIWCFLLFKHTINLCKIIILYLCIQKLLLHFLCNLIWWQTRGVHIWWDHLSPASSNKPSLIEPFC